MDSLMIYDAIRLLLPSGLSISYQTMDSSSPQSVGIFLYDNGDEEIDLDGDDVYRTCRVHIQMNSDRSISSLQTVLNTLTNFTYNIEKCYSPLSQISFLYAKHLGQRASVIGKNEFELNVCSCDVMLYYTFNVKG